MHPLLAEHPTPSLPVVSPPYILAAPANFNVKMASLRGLDGPPLWGPRVARARVTRAGELLPSSPLLPSLALLLSWFHPSPPSSNFTVNSLLSVPRSESPETQEE